MGPAGAVGAETASVAEVAETFCGAGATVAGLAAKINREEAYHRIHAQMWFDRLQGEPRFAAALAELRPQTAVLLDSELRGAHTPELPELWNEMTMVRRSQPAGTKW